MTCSKSSNSRDSYHINCCCYTYRSAYGSSSRT